MAHECCARDRFFLVPRTPRATSEGTVELPILYYDVSNVIAVFMAKREGVERALEGTGLAPAIVSGDEAAVALSFYEYRETSVGVYNEVGTAIFVVRQGERPRFGFADLLRSARARAIGALVIDLPVTTPAAHAAGRELWGYPKFVAPIPFHLQGREFDGAVLDPDGGGATEILRLAGRMGPGLPAPPLSLMTYTFLDDALVRTHVDVRGRVGVHLPGTLHLSIGTSKHRMAENLRALGLQGARPRLVMRTDRFQSKLHEGVRVSPVLDGRRSRVD